VTDASTCQGDDINVKNLAKRTNHCPAF